MPYTPLPVNSASLGVGSVLGGTTQLFDSSAGAIALPAGRLQAAGAMEFAYPATWPSGALTLVGQTAPWTWAQSDSILSFIFYEI